MDNYMRKINDIRQYAAQHPNGDPSGRDQDTILSDIYDNIETEVSGHAEELFKLFEKSKDRDTFIKLFYAITGESFAEYLNRVLRHQKAMAEMAPPPDEDYSEPNARIHITDVRTADIPVHIPNKILNSACPEDAIQRLRLAAAGGENLPWTMLVQKPNILPYIRFISRPADKIQHLPAINVTMWPDYTINIDDDRPSCESKEGSDNNG